MKRVVRILLGLTAAVAVVAIIAVVIVGMNLDSTVRDAVVHYGPQYTGTPVQLERVDLSPLAGRGEIRGLQIDNPDGFEGPFAIRVDTLRIALEPRSLLDDVIRVQSLQIAGVELDAEMASSGQLNLRAILANVQAATGNDAPPPEQAGGVKVSIDRLDLVGAEAVLRAPAIASIDTVAVDVPEVHLRDLGRDGGVTAGEVGVALLRPVVARIVEAVARRGVLDAIESRGGKLGERLERLKERFPLQP